MFGNELKIFIRLRGSVTWVQSKLYVWGLKIIQTIKNIIFMTRERTNLSFPLPFISSPVSYPAMSISVFAVSCFIDCAIVLMLNIHYNALSWFHWFQLSCTNFTVNKQTGAPAATFKQISRTFQMCVSVCECGCVASGRILGFVAIIVDWIGHCFRTPLSISWRMYIWFKPGHHWPTHRVLGLSLFNAASCAAWSTINRVLFGCTCNWVVHGSQ